MHYFMPYTHAFSLFCNFRCIYLAVIGSMKYRPTYMYNVYNNSALDCLYALSYSSLYIDIDLLTLIGHLRFMFIYERTILNYCGLPTF